jgi:hypothetical protein
MHGRVITGASMVLVGAIWVGQGLGLLRGSSFMVDDMRWAVTGLVAIAFGAVVAFSGWRRDRPDRPDRPEG